MGIIADEPILCQEAIYQDVLEMHQAKGKKGVIFTVPDELDEVMVARLAERAEYLIGKMTIIRSKYQGKTIKFIRSD
jgi:hypothetical protein